MPLGARLILIERLLPKFAKHQVSTTMVDIQMMVVTGGRERRLEEYSRLLEQAGFSVSATSRTAYTFALIEAMPA
jgi:hypothetical protein